MQEQYHIVGVTQTFPSRNAPQIRNTRESQNTREIRKALENQKEGDSQS